MLLFWAFRSLLTLLFLPGGHYLFAWPLLLPPRGCSSSFWTESGSFCFSGGYGYCLYFICNPALLLLMPVLAILYILLSFPCPKSCGSVRLLLGFFIPWLTLPAGKMKWATPLVAAVLALLLIGGGLINAAVHPFQPRFGSIILAHDADSGESRWISLDAQAGDYAAASFRNPFLPARTAISLTWSANLSTARHLPDSKRAGSGAAGGRQLPAEAGRTLQLQPRTGQAAGSTCSMT